MLINSFKYSCLIGVLIMLATCAIDGFVAAPVYSGPTSDHFDGEVFFNREGGDKSAAEVAKFFWQYRLNRAEWPQWIDSAQKTEHKPQRSNELRVTFINHSSFLIQVDGVNILTDPVFSQRVSPFSWMGPKRVRPAGLSLDALPPIDVILISHNHYDHLDIESLKVIAKQHSPAPILLAGLGNGAYFKKQGLARYQDLDWNDSWDTQGLNFYFVENKHRSGRGITDQMKTLWGGFVIESSQGKIYFAGDTGYGQHFSATRTRFGPIRLALLPIGAYEPRWFMRSVHLNPEDAVKAHLDLAAEYSIGIHFGTFQLTSEAIDQPLIDLAAARKKYGVPAHSFRVLTTGETRVFN